MSFTPPHQLQSNSNISLRSQQHASRLFVDDQFRLAPKHNFLFHVAFNINQEVLKNIELVQKYKNEINMLVKSIDLPSFEIKTTTFNQYNRKKIIQYRHNPKDISIKFHDDNMGLINQVWQNYYSYYYADSTTAKKTSTFAKNATRNSSFITGVYGLDNGSNKPFFNYITIYQMARHEYVSYKLINPIITGWNHNKLSYSDGNVRDFDMTIGYEAISYDTGFITATEKPEGFAEEHYDNTPSPLTAGPQSDGLNEWLGASFSNPAVDAWLSNANTKATQINTYQNTSTDSSGVSVQNSITSTIGGLNGTTFPTGNSSSDNTNATSGVTT